MSDNHNLAIIVRKEIRGWQLPSVDHIVHAACLAARSPQPVHHRVANLYQSIRDLERMIQDVERLGQTRPEWFARCTAIVRLLKQAKRLMEVQHRAIEMVVEQVLERF
jgi:hypothetical protein